MASQGGAEDASGPSLFQARSTRHNHNHFQHDDLVYTHNHNHQIRHHRQHHRLHPTEVDAAASQHIRSPPKREGDLEGPPVVVFQTVSVVHYLDARGAVTSVGTLTSTPTPGNPVGPPDLLDPVAPILSALPAAVSAVLTGIGAVLPSVSFSGLLPDPTDGAPSSTTSAETETTVSTSSSETSTSTHSTTTTTASFPSLTGAKNSSSTHHPTLFGNHTAGIFSNHTRAKSFASSRSTTLWTTPTIANTPAIATAPGGPATIDAVPSTTVAPAPVPDPQHSSTLPPETRNAVVGGVVGSVAAISLIVLALLYLLKWKKQRGGGIMLLGDNDPRSRGRGLGSPDPSSPGGGGRTMAERTTGAFTIPAALARLSGKRAIGAAPPEPESQERGFYRVSGRKLVSVLESGGDGYTEPQPREHRPHDSVGSGSPSRYRDSNPFSDSASIGTDNNDTHLQLGTPMRPVSGVPIYRDGAHRTPVQQHGPYSADIRSSVFPMTSPFADDADHSITSIASRGSGSRFLEEDTL
ncbi:uncharacterized protein C8A04DRAFT_37162 [Dichotomopilus funicola]|uniref:Uncharacterized protein n=1 Tax=Dichotomopilus funicola TaxID=1934379 RepID=A0AAN6ZMV1_9PEZI|nr:hypothetical protein C8A04DRAFT_37162 [Dichotomopilus funicola]